MKINVNMTTNTPTINGNISQNSPEIVGNFATNGIDVNNLTIRVTNLENNAIGSINASYNAETSILSLTTKNTLNEDIGTATNITLPTGLSNIEYIEENKSLILSLSNGTIMNVSLKESFDKINTYIENLQSQIDELEMKKLDKVSYLNASDIDNYFNN